MMWRDARSGADGPRGVARLVGESGPMRELKALIPRVAASPFPVVVEGETGTGKELIARALHEEGPRRGAVFVPVNCAVLGDELFESELFGHARGAFTGAAQERKGLLELSAGGTVFLDEVAELTPRAQAKLLRVLQDGEIRRLGENRTQRLDLRVVAATNRPLNDEAAAGRFRKDLLYRLGVVGLTAPPLRERGPDVARLADHCWKDIAAARRPRRRRAGRHPPGPLEADGPTPDRPVQSGPRAAGPGAVAIIRDRGRSLTGQATPGHHRRHEQRRESGSVRNDPERHRQDRAAEGSRGRVARPPRRTEGRESAGSHAVARAPRGDRPQGQRGAVGEAEARRGSAMTDVELSLLDETTKRATRLGNNVAWMCANCDRQNPMLFSVRLGGRNGGVACPNCGCYYRVVVRDRVPQRVEQSGNPPVEG